MKRAALASTRSSLSRGSHGDGSSPTEHENYDIKASSSHIWCSAKFPRQVSPSLTQNARRSPHSLWATIRLKPFAVLLLPSLLFVVLAGAGLFLILFFSTQESSNRQSVASTQALIVVKNIQAELLKIQTPFLLLESYVHHFPSDPAFLNKSYTQLGYEAMKLIGENKTSHKDPGSIYCLWLCPLGRLRYWYPADSPDSSMNGMDFLSVGSPFRSLLLSQSVSGSLSLVGPLAPNPLGITFQMFYPIFVSDVDANETFGEPSNVSSCHNCYNNATRTKYWGFSFILVIWDRFITRISIDELKSKLGLDYQLVYNSISTVNGSSVLSKIILAGQNNSMPSDALSFPINVDPPANLWMLYVKDSRGWQPVYTWPLVAVVIAVSFILSFLLALYLATVSQKRDFWTALEVSNGDLERSKESLMKEKGRMEALLLRHHDLIFCLEGAQGAGWLGKRSSLSSHSTSESTSTPSSGFTDPDSGNHEKIYKLAGQLMNQATSEIQIRELIGVGSYGKVYKGVWQGQVVAVKSVILPSSMTQLEKRITMAMMEVSVSAKLSHPSIVQAYTYRMRPLEGNSCAAGKRQKSEQMVPAGVIVGGAGASTINTSLFNSSVSSLPSSPPVSNTHPNLSLDGTLVSSPRAPPEISTVSPSVAVVAYEVLLVLEYMEGGNVWDVTKKGLLKKADGSVDHKTVLSIISNIASGLLHLHANDVIHSDVKAENVMIKSHGFQPLLAKLGDFGLALDFNGLDKTHQSKAFQGTPTHMAPETLRMGRVGKPSDVFSFGITMYEIWSGLRPYTHEQATNQSVLATGVVEGMRPLWSRVAHDRPSVLFQAYQALAEECWHEDPLSRPSFTEICSRLDNMIGMPDAEHRTIQPKPLEEQAQVQVEFWGLGGEKDPESPRSREILMMNEDQMEKGLVAGVIRRERVSGCASYKTVSSRFNSTLLPIRE